jgi:hypothetical protein
MSLDYRKALLAVLARLDQITADAEAILDEPGDVENAALAGARQLLAEMRAKTEVKLDALTPENYSWAAR